MSTSRIIFSIFNDNVDQNHKSTNDYKLSQFRKYKPQLIECKEKYAKKFGAEFILHETPTTDYNKIQFEKILLLEEYAKTYDQILYLDFDIVPLHTAASIFDEIDDKTLAMHPLDRWLDNMEIREYLEMGWFDNQNVFCKTAAKKSMLLDEDITSNDLLYNTGVVYGGSEIIKQLKFGERLDELHERLDDAREWSLYPDEITKNFYYNNEVYISYIVEEQNLPHTNLPLSWNYILDGYMPEPSAAAHFLHHVNKEFDKSFG